ncbi:MAG TPA: ABC transporter permease [Acetobacteraceae bacterium]|nr:ABC transporter permease [Acetobacteraceae bacterium]
MRAIRSALGRASLLPALAMLAVVVALNAWLQPHFFGRPSLESNIATFAPTILVCVAQAVVVLNRQLDLSVGAGVSLINCALAALPADLPGGGWSACVIGLALALALGAVNGALVAFLELPSLIATFATGAVWFGLALALMPQPGGAIAPGLGDLYGADWIGLPVPLLIVAAAMAVWVALGRHRIGRWIVAVGSSPGAAYQAGVPVRWATFGAYLTAWVLVFLSALTISAQTLSGDARLGQTYTLTSVAAVVIGGVSLGGGRGSPWGALLGALVLGIIANVIYFAGIPSIWQEFFKGLVIMAALGFMVSGQRRRVAA